MLSQHIDLSGLRPEKSSHVCCCAFTQPLRHPWALWTRRGSQAGTALPGLSPEIVLFVLLCYTEKEQSLNNHNHCLLLEIRLKRACNFCILKHNTRVYVNFECELGGGLLQEAVCSVQSFLCGCVPRAVPAPWQLNGFHGHALHCWCLALTCFPSCFAQF